MIDSSSPRHILIEVRMKPEFPVEDYFAVVLGV